MMFQLSSNQIRSSTLMQVVSQL